MEEAVMEDRGPWVFIPYDLSDGIRMLTNTQAGRLFDAIFEYAFEHEEPNFDDDPMLKLAWAFVMPSLETGE